MQGSYGAPTSPAAHSCRAAAWDNDSTHMQSQGSSMGAATLGSPLRTVTSAAAGVSTTSWAAGIVDPEEMLERCASSYGIPEPTYSGSPLSSHGAILQQQVQQEDVSAWQSGVKHAGWLWRRFGRGHKTKWKRLWFYLEDDRLCYCQPDKLAGNHSSGATTSSGMYGSMGSTGMNASHAFMSSLTARSTAGGMSSTSGSAAALAAGQIKYIALDRIPVRPLPKRQHSMDPMRKSHPDLGVAIIDARVLTGQPNHSPQRTVFSLVAGSHTHYLAAETLSEAQLWVSAIRETWLHCFAHTARKTTSGSSRVVMSQRLLAENAQLRESIQELNQKVSQSDYEYWRKWVEEKSKNQILEAKLINAATYEVLVKTGSVKGAQTDARVYMEMYGPDNVPTAATAAGVAATGNLAGIAGSTRLLDIDSLEKPFKKGALDRFVVLCYDVGLPAKVKVWHDNTGCHPDWFLVEMKVRKKGARDWVCFPCNRWLSTQLDDGRICRELIGGASKPQMAYQVVTHTSDVRGAGTDAAVSIQLHGLLGDGLKQQLMGGPTDFDRGQRNEFFIEDADLGELTAVTICHDGSGTSPAWHLSHIEVIPMACPLYGDSNCSLNAAAGFRPNSPAGGSSSTTLGHTMNQSTPRTSSLLSRSAEPGVRCSGSMKLGQVGLKEVVVYLFPCDAWLDERLGDGRTERKLQAASGMVAKSWYSLHITTSDVRGAGTDADVHVVLMGSEGSSERLQLPSKPEHFERGCRDTFRLQIPRLGQLQKLLIGHNGRGDSPSWHLALVEIVEEDTGRVVYFAADRWIGAAARDGLFEITLTATSADPRLALVEYQVCFLTSALRGAGTESTVGFELHGDRGSSGPITVVCGPETFERGGSDSFTYARPWLGQLQRLVVWHDNAGAAGDRGPWHLEAVEVTCSRDQKIVNFPCGRWLSAETQLKVQLQPGCTMGLTRYRFDVVTSNVRGAGTDGALQVELLGSSAGPAAVAAATAGPWCLDRSGAFARGSTDSFYVKGVEVGKPGSLKVTLQGGSLNPDWHLSHIVCTVLDGADDAEGSKCYFSAERWFDASHGFTATLPCSLKPPGRADEGQLPYIIKVFTFNMKGAGTDANISINIMGIKGPSGWQLLPARQETFERGQEDSFTLKLPDFGALTHLAIKSDGLGEAPAWHLDKVCIIPPATNSSHSSAGQAGVAAASCHMSRAASLAIKAVADSNAFLLVTAASQLAGTATPTAAAGATGFGTNGQPVWFVARRWLDAVHGLDVVLEAQAVDPAKNLVTYAVEVYTSDLKNAGTDARVMLQLIGDKATSPPHELQDPTAPTECFLRGGGDAFALQLPRLGQLSNARIWLDGPGSPWHLQLILVTGPEGETIYFPCGAWLRLGAAVGSSPGVVVGSAAQPMELQATRQDPRQRMKEYKVVTRTSNVQGAATDAAVFVELLGAEGITSGRQKLTPTHPQAFEQGSVDDLRVLCEDLGEVVQLRIGHDNSGTHPAWHLLQVEVTDIAAGRTWYFEADCWLKSAHGESRIERLLAASATDPLADRERYQVFVHTSKTKGSNTDGTVFVTLHGTKGPPVTCKPHKGSTSSSGSGLMPSVSLTQQPLAAVTAAVAAATVSIPKTPGSAAGGSSASTGMLSSGRHTLRGSDATAGRAAFVDGGTGSFALPPVKSLGQLQLLTLELESTTDEPCSWHCQHLEVVCSSTGQCWLFPCNAWLATSSSSSSRTSEAPASAGPQLLLYPAPSLDSMWRQIQEQQQEEYQFALYTLQAFGAGTDSAVSVTLYGATGEAGPFKLSAAGQNCFKQGSCDVFILQIAAKLGQLLRLKVASDGAGQGSAWHLDTVAVTAKSTGATTWFYAGRWLSKPAGLEAVLQGADADIRQHLVSYKVTVHTGDVPGAGTDARVYVDLRGSSGSSGPQELSKPSGANRNCFERGHADTFMLSTRDCGELTELLVWHDHDGFAAGWNLTYIEVQLVATGQVWYFPCGQWLDGSHGDKATRRTLKATKTFDLASLQCSYCVTVTTGNVRGAGTDANVFISIHGSQGETGRKVLAKQGRNCFERGQCDEFKVSAADVGDMSHVLVGHDGNGAAAAWHLAELEVQHMGTGQTLKFSPNRWFDAKRPGSSLQCELWPEKQQAVVALATSSQQVVWEVLVITGKVLGAGTDADVFITLKGNSGSFGPYTLPAGPEAFETGCTDTFKFATPDVGEIKEVVIGHNNMGVAAAWFLQGLELLNTNTDAKYTFKVAAWLNVQNGCCRTLQPVQQNSTALVGSGHAKPPSSCSYQVEIQTSDVDGAGTDAAVFIQVAGDHGESAAVQLQAPGSSADISTRALFQRGLLDVFILRGLPCLGTLTHITIGHDGTGANPAWHLAWVRIVNLTSGERALFTANCWLDSSSPGSNNWVQLPGAPDSAVQPLAARAAAVPQQQQQQPPRPGQLSGSALFGASSLREQKEFATGSLKFTKSWMHTSRLGQPGYKVTFVTSNIMGAGTAAKVFFELIGEHGSTGVVYPASQSEQFQRGHQDSFLYPRLPYIGQLYQLRVGCDGSGMFAPWHLRQVEVVHVQTGQQWCFDCHDWIDKKCTWQRVLPAAPVTAVM